MTQLTGPRSAYRVVGTSPAHHDFVDKVKGSLHYAADWQLPGMLHGRIVRSPLPSARITGIDVTAARASMAKVTATMIAKRPSEFMLRISSQLRFDTVWPKPSTSRRADSTGSWVVIPTGHRPVWQWWQA